MYSAEGVHYDGYSPVGARRFLTTERGIALGLVYIASLVSKWNWQVCLLRLRTLARFLVWGRLYLEMEGPSEMVGRGI